MSSELARWAVAERQFLSEEKHWLKAGGKILSPSGDDITAERLEQLEIRLEHANKALKSQTMPTGPKGQKRPADVIGNAVKIARIATGEETDEQPDDGKDKAAQALGRKGGKKRAESMTPERRAEIARRAAAKRWAKDEQ